jgi:hypothetical protein
VYASNIGSSTLPIPGDLEEVVHHPDGIETRRLGRGGDRRHPLEQIVARRHQPSS